MSVDTRKSLSKRNKIFIAIILAVTGISISTLPESFAYVTTTPVFTPPDYSTFQPPAKGGSYIDPVFGSAIKRISNAMTTVDAGNGGSVTTIGPEYSTMSPFNKDNTRLLIQYLSYLALYDGDGNFLKDLYQYGVHASSEPRWSRTDTNVFYFVNGNQLKSFNIGTNVVSVIHAFTEYSAISGQGESDISFDGTHFVFCGDGRYVFVYDIANAVKGSILDASGHAFDSLYITPDNHVTITWLTVGSSRYNGIEMFDQNMNFLRQLTHAGGHMDVTRDTNGDEVLVWANFNDAALTTPCTAGVTKIRLADAKQTCIWKGDWGEAVHVSGTDNSGWAFVEAYSSRNLNPSTDWTAYQGELLQVKLDGTEVRRLAHHRSRPFSGNTYTYMPKMSASRDGTKIVFASNYGLQSILGYPSNYSDAYLIDLSQASPNTGGTSSTSTTTTSGGTTSESGSTTTGGTTTGSTRSTTTVTRIEDNDPSVAYIGTWSTNSLTIHSGSHAVLSMDANSTATVSFNGTGVTVLGYRDEWSGIARIYLDGTLKGDVDTYATPSLAKVPMYSVSGLPAGTHTVQVVVTGTKNATSGGKWVWIDAFDVESAGAASNTTSSGTTTTGTGSTTTTNSSGTTSTTSTPPPPAGTLYRIEDNNTAIRYTGTWNVHAGSVHTGNSATLAMDSGYRATFTFVGTSITWVGYRDPWSGIARVYIDDVLKSEIDTYSSTDLGKVTIYTVSDLTWGSHTIAIEATGRRGASAQGAWIWLDAFDYVGATE